MLFVSFVVKKIMKQSGIPSVFREIVDRPLNRRVEDARAGGRRAIGYTCSYVPEPLISVDGLLPVRVRAPGVAGTPMADTYMSAVTCSYTRSLLEFAMQGSFDHLDGWVFTASCDHLRRLYDNLAYLIDPPFRHIIDLPHKTGDQALAWYVEDLRQLAGALSSHFGVDTGPEALRAAIERHNESLALVRAIGDLRRRDRPPLTGADFHTILVACASAPRETLTEELGEFGRTLTESRGIDDYRARLLLVGSQLDDPGAIEVIESVGGLVVADRFCSGSIPGLEPIPADGDPLRALAEHSLRKISCPRMMEDFEARLEAVLRAAGDYRADGIVIETMKFCDTWGVESGLLASALRRAGMPVLRLEREYALSGEGQVRTRVQAFLESMGK